MDVISGQSSFFNLGKVLFGPGKVRELGAELDQLGGRRAIVVTGKTLGASPLLKRVTDALGPRCAGVFTGIAQHVPGEGIDALAAEIKRLEVDSVVSFGGGSPGDAAKAAIGCVLSGKTSAELATIRLMDVADIGDDPRDIFHVTLPTTLSAAEYTPGGGATSREGVKGSIMNPRLQIRTIINDPELTVDTSDELWTSTGVRALDHVVEAFYSQYNQSFTDALAAKALTLLLEHLPASVTTTGEERIRHRGLCQTAAFLSNYAAMNTRYGVSHAVGHNIGPRWQLAHGITSCISLPHGMRFMADRVPERFEMLARALDIPFDRAAPAAAAGACVARIAAFIDSMGLPRTLAAVGIAPDQFDEVIDGIHFEVELLDAVGMPTSREEIAQLLGAMSGGETAGRKLQDA